MDSQTQMGFVILSLILAPVFVQTSPSPYKTVLVSDSAPETSPYPGQSPD